MPLAAKKSAKSRSACRRYFSSVRRTSRYCQAPASSWRLASGPSACSSRESQKSSSASGASTITSVNRESADWKMLSTSSSPKNWRSSLVSWAGSAEPTTIPARSRTLETSMRETMSSCTLDCLKRKSPVISTSLMRMPVWVLTEVNKSLSPGLKVKPSWLSNSSATALFNSTPCWPGSQKRPSRISTLSGNMAWYCPGMMPKSCVAPKVLSPLDITAVAETWGLMAAT